MLLFPLGIVTIYWCPAPPTPPPHTHTHTLTHSLTTVQIKDYNILQWATIDSCAMFNTVALFLKNFSSRSFEPVPVHWRDKVQYTKVYTMRRNVSGEQQQQKTTIRIISLKKRCVMLNCTGPPGPSNYTLFEWNVYWKHLCKIIKVRGKAKF